MPRLGDRVRAFLAIGLSDDVRARMSQLQAELRTAKINMRWVRPDNVHLTLLFLGDTPLEQIAELSLALREYEDYGPPFTLRLAGLGAFPQLDRARVLWVGVHEGSDELAALQKTVAGIVRESGCRFDKKPFSPHLTLGRASDRGGSRIVLPEGMEDADLGELLVTRFALIRSELRSGGSVYSDLCTMPLG